MNPHHGRARALVQPEPDRAQAQAARWRVRRALSRLRAAGAVPVRREPHLHAGRRTQGKTVRSARLPSGRARRGGAAGRARVRQRGRRRPDRRQTGELPRRRAAAARHRGRRNEAPPRAGLSRRAVQLHAAPRRCGADLIAAKPGSYRGVALLPPGIEVAEMKRLHEQGFRGVRFNYMQHLGAAVPIADVMKLAARMAGIGWHLQLHMESSLIAGMTPALKLSPVPVVIDHMGRIDASHGLDQPEFKHLLSLLEDKRFWVKVCGVERASRQGAPYADAVPFARKLVQEFGDRTLWGTDWPHPNLAAIPDDGVLVDLLAEIAPSEAQRQALLVDNPQRLYKFS